MLKKTLNKNLINCFKFNLFFHSYFLNRTYKRNNRKVVASTKKLKILVLTQMTFFHCCFLLLFFRIYSWYYNFDLKK
jgi:hypothetical protein